MERKQDEQESSEQNLTDRQGHPITNNFAESEQIATGTGVLVEGLDFSDDKMLVGRTLSYSDTRRATPAGRHSLGSRATKVESKQPSEGNTEREKDRHV